MNSYERAQSRPPWWSVNNRKGKVTKCQHKRHSLIVCLSTNAKWLQCNIHSQHDAWVASQLHTSRLHGWPLYTDEKHITTIALR